MLQNEQKFEIIFINIPLSTNGNLLPLLLISSNSPRLRLIAEQFSTTTKKEHLMNVFKVEDQLKKLSSRKGIIMQINWYKYQQYIPPFLLLQSNIFVP